ncbi:MAG: histidine phosphatase family protein [Anaerolineales bacterium]|nr:histidine phosphatase family protein [Anaerolineales bacterium]
MTRVLLIRHGQTEWNRVDRFRGRADVPLNKAGLHQAAATAERVSSEWKPAAVYSSPLSRSMGTAKAVADRCGLPVEICRGLGDIDYGRWQGLTVAEARSRWPADVDAWFAEPHRARIPGGESVAAVRARATQAVRRAACSHPDQTIVLVSHVVVIRTILLDALNATWDRFWKIGQENCAVNVLDVDDTDIRVDSLNDTCHLSGAG